jgi:cellulose synthase/poly-beta-1,6-N-acetylglucosamine synthase-like glycosyltransferase
MTTLLDVLALTLIIMHFGIPLLYYWYSKTKWLPRPWNINVNPSYLPRITIIVPTYNEAKFVERKLDNIYEQEYPRDKLEVIVVDSASTDNTPTIVRKWAERHPDLNLKLIEEHERGGKARALNTALGYTSTGEIVIITDVDAWWPFKNTLSEVAKWFADPIVGAVSCLKNPAGTGVAGVEEGYRQYYNILRLAESKAWATPIFHGELVAFRKELLEKLGGLPTDIGADDSHTATRIALMGYRAITPETIWCVESIPQGKDYHSWRIRRAQHLIQHFLKTLKLKHKTSKTFKKILGVEAYLHILNPWLLIIVALLLICGVFMKSLVSLLLLALGVILLAYRPYRLWITLQIYLTIATLRNLYTKELVWKKESK